MGIVSEIAKLLLGVDSVFGAEYGIAFQDLETMRTSASKDDIRRAMNEGMHKFIEGLNNGTNDPLFGNLRGAYSWAGVTERCKSTHTPAAHHKHTIQGEIIGEVKLDFGLGWFKMTSKSANMGASGTHPTISLEEDTYIPPEHVQPPTGSVAGAFTGRTREECKILTVWGNVLWCRVRIVTGETHELKAHFPDVFAPSYLEYLALYTAGKVKDELIDELTDELDTVKSTILDWAAGKKTKKEVAEALQNTKIRGKSQLLSGDRDTALRRLKSEALTLPVTEPKRIDHEEIYSS